MKRGGPLKRTPLERLTPLERARPTPRAPQPRFRELTTPKRKPTTAARRNDGPWRQVCADRRGLWCRASALGGCEGPLQCDHIWPRSQGGPSVVENGCFLCRAHHDDKTAGRLQYRWEWLDPDQHDWLAAVSWVGWDGDGQPFGVGWRHFAAMTSAQVARLNARVNRPASNQEETGNDRS